MTNCHPQPIRMTSTLVCALIFILLPLASSHLNTLDILSISAGILAFAVSFDFYARTFTISTRKAMMVAECEMRRKRVREEGVGVVEREEEEGWGNRRQTEGNEDMHGADLDRI